LPRIKNEFPDFTLLTNPMLAIEIKSGNHYKLQDGRWSSCSNSENDMGTLNKWPEKLRMFGGQYIYYVFIEYSLTDTLADCKPSAKMGHSLGHLNRTLGVDGTSSNEIVN
jgi:hypothetical protein